VTAPSSIAEMFNLLNGSTVEVEAQSIDSFQVRCR
jgi:antitoxin component of MazEF toxin-antitoxin module